MIVQASSDGGSRNCAIRSLISQPAEGGPHAHGAHRAKQTASSRMVCMTSRRSGIRRQISERPFPFVSSKKRRRCHRSSARRKLRTVQPARDGVQTMAAYRHTCPGGHGFLGFAGCGAGGGGGGGTCTTAGAARCGGGGGGGGGGAGCTATLAGGCVIGAIVGVGPGCTIAVPGPVGGGVTPGCTAAVPTRSAAASLPDAPWRYPHRSAAASLPDAPGRSMVAAVSLPDVPRRYPTGRRRCYSRMHDRCTRTCRRHSWMHRGGASWTDRRDRCRSCRRISSGCSAVVPDRVGGG